MPTTFVRQLKVPIHSNELKWWPIRPSSCYLLHFRAPTTLDMETRVMSSVRFFSFELITKKYTPAQTFAQNVRSDKPFTTNQWHISSG